jgi:cytochrome P450 family 710 subfamily A protein
MMLTQVTRRIFTFNDPSTLLMGVHPSARNILGDANLAFMHGPAHKVSRLNHNNQQWTHS